jgi:flagellar hook-basal body complex protein FliE
LRGRSTSSDNREIHESFLHHKASVCIRFDRLDSCGNDIRDRGSSFAEAIGSAINAVESSQQSAKTAAVNLLTGGQGDIHSVALASQRAELSLELFQQVRNKFVSAYQEIMKMPM